MGFLKNALSTRKAMQKTPALDFIRELSDDELHALQDCFLEIIKDVADACERHGICYMAAGGTALGSVRHRGFIPWDDDVDLLMPRKDLKRFLEIFDETLGDRYEITSPDSKYPLESMITAVYKKGTYKASLSTLDTDLPKGVHIDIFSIDTVPVNPVIRRIKGTAAMGLQYIAVSTLFRKLSSPKKKEFFGQTGAGKVNYAIRMTVGTVFSFLPCEKWAAWFDRFVSCRKDTGLWAVPTDIGHYFGHIMPKDVYVPPVKGPFEDMEINLPHDPDAYLKNQYGDYMTIPPEADREKHWSIGFDLGGGEGESHE